MSKYLETLKAILLIREQQDWHFQLRSKSYSNAPLQLKPFSCFSVVVFWVWYLVKSVAYSETIHRANWVRVRGIALLSRMTLEVSSLFSSLKTVWLVIFKEFSILPVSLTDPTWLYFSLGTVVYTKWLAHSSTLFELNCYCYLSYWMTA